MNKLTMESFLQIRRTEKELEKKPRGMWCYIALAVICSAWGLMIGLFIAGDRVETVQLNAVVMEGDCYFDDVEDTLPCYFMKK